MNKKARADGTNPFAFKAGFEGLDWGGMRTQGDPSENPPTQPRLLINARKWGKGWRERFGWKTHTTLHDTLACVRSISNYDVANPVKLWIVGDGCPGISTSIGFYLSQVDMEQDPEFQRSYYYETATQALIADVFDADLHIIVDDALRRVRLLLQPWGTEQLAIGGSGTDTPLVTYPGFIGSALKSFDGKLFVGLAAGAGSKIATWDGITNRNDLTGINPPTAFGLYHEPNGGDAIFVGFDAASNQIRYRPRGASPGTWTTVSPSSGTVASVQMEAFKDVLWITTGSDFLCRYNGSSLDPVLSGTLGIVAGSETTALTIARGQDTLLMGYTAGGALIAEWDGTAWTGVKKDITAQFPGAIALRDLKWYRGHVIAGCTHADGGGRLYLALETDLTGDWTEVIPNTLNNGDMSQFLVA